MTEGVGEVAATERTMTTTWHADERSEDLVNHDMTGPLRCCWPRSSTLPSAGSGLPGHLVWTQVLSRAALPPLGAGSRSAESQIRPTCWWSDSGLGHTPRSVVGGHTRRRGCLATD
jgi:hypothetical protein